MIELLLSLRIVTTTVLFRFTLGRALTKLKVLALTLLLLGTMTAQLSTCREGIEAHVPWRGVIAALLYCCLSAFAGVFVEALLKRARGDSFYEQNAQLAAFGVCLNGTVMVCFYWHELREGGLWSMLGDAAGIQLVVAHALCGLSISALVKYADNILKIYAHSASLILTLVAASIIFNTAPSLQLVFGAAVVTASIYLYHLDDQEQVQHLN